MFGESEGKNHKGIYPTLSLFTTDLHSIGQFMQEGTSNFFETTLLVTKPRKDMTMKVQDNEDGLRYLNNKTIDFINKKAIEATLQAHTQIGDRNNIVIEITNTDEFHFGYLFY
jgi:glucose-6-phosphate isomerase